MTDDSSAAIILCAGLGTRLRPLTLSVPKPAIPFLGLPLAGHALGAIQRAGIRQVAANLYHLPEAMQLGLERASEALAYDGQLRFSWEERSNLGTGGGARLAAELFPEAERFVIYHGDVLSSCELKAALAEHLRAKAEVSLVVAERPEHCRLGYLGVDPDLGVVQIREWRQAAASREQIEAAAPRLFTGIHIVERRLLERIEPRQSACLVTGLYRACLEAGERLHAIETKGFFADLGTPESFLEAQAAALRQPEGLALPSPGRALEGPRIHPPVWAFGPVHIAEGAELGPNVVLSHGAQVLADEKLQETLRFGPYTLKN